MNPTTENVPTLGYDRWVCIMHAPDAFQHAPVVADDAQGRPVIETRDGLLSVADLGLHYVTYDLRVVRLAVQGVLTEAGSA